MGEGKHPEDSEFTREVTNGSMCNCLKEGWGDRVKGTHGRALGEEELRHISVCEGRE